jgi:hypothetical protein
VIFNVPESGKTSKPAPVTYGIQTLCRRVSPIEIWAQIPDHGVVIVRPGGSYAFLSSSGADNFCGINARPKEGLSKGSADYPADFARRHAPHAQRRSAVKIRWSGWAFTPRRNYFRAETLSHVRGSSRETDLIRESLRGDVGGANSREEASCICPQSLGNIPFHLSPKLRPKSKRHQSFRNVPIPSVTIL